MNCQKEIILSGVGGQGMILCGTLIAEAAVIYDQKLATLSSEYGTETRGTFAKSDVIVSEEPIYFPHVTKPDLVVCLHQVAYERYSGKLSPKALLIYDSVQVTPYPENAAREKGVSVSEMAKELKNPATANILTMGVILGLLHLVSPEGAKGAIQNFFASKGEKVVALNHRAFDMGYAYGEALCSG